MGYLHRLSSIVTTAQEEVVFHLQSPVTITINSVSKWVVSLHTSDLPIWLRKPHQYSRYLVLQSSMLSCDDMLDSALVQRSAARSGEKHVPCGALHAVLAAQTIAALMLCFKNIFLPALSVQRRNSLRLQRFQTIRTGGRTDERTRGLGSQCPPDPANPIGPPLYHSAALCICMRCCCQLHWESSP